MLIPNILSFYFSFYLYLLLFSSLYFPHVLYHDMIAVFSSLTWDPNYDLYFLYQSQSLVASPNPYFKLLGRHPDLSPIMNSI